MIMPNQGANWSISKNIWIGLALVVLSSIGVTFIVKFHATHIERDEATRFINQKLSERTRSLEIERERLSRQIDSLEAVESVQLPPKIITVVKKVPVPETWWLSPSPDTIVDTIFSGWIDVEVDSLKHQ
jgi:hypothetical protein